MKKGFLLCFALLVLYFAAVPTSAAPEWLATAGCCQSQCSVNSDCDAICGPGLGRCLNAGAPCCRLCVCSPGGT
jgi:hypothetical protein